MSTTYKKGTTETAKRAVLYARVSSDDRGNDGRNLDGQLDMCRMYAQENGWRVVAELAEDDKGASGAAFELPKLKQALEMAQARGFDVLVVRELDRLSRNLAKQLIVEEELGRAGVQIEYAMADYPDTPEGRLNKHIRATIAEFEREKIAERMSRGRRQKVKAGSVLVAGRPPYGYDVAEVDGKTTLVINQKEARIINLIFTWYVEGDEKGRVMTINDIVHRLGEMGIPTRGDQRPEQHWKKRGRGQWHRGTVHRMLTNETYCGVWHYGKRRRNGGGWVFNDSSDQLPVSVPPIVSADIWEAVQVRLAENTTRRPPRRYQYLMSGRVTCGECGLKMAGKPGGTQRYYRCPARSNPLKYARKCSSPGFRSDRVDAVMWEWMVSFLTDPIALETGLWAHHQELEAQNKPIRVRLAVIDDLLSNNREQLERLLDLYLAGDFNREVLTDRKARLEETITALEKERDELTAYLGARVLSVEQIQTIQEFAAKIGENLEAMGDDFDARRGLIEALDVRATLVVEDGQQLIYARCLLDEDTFLTSRTIQGIVRPLWHRSKALTEPTLWQSWVNGC